MENRTLQRNLFHIQTDNEHYLEYINIQQQIHTRSPLADSFDILKVDEFFSLLPDRVRGTTISPTAKAFLLANGVTRFSKNQSLVFDYLTGQLAIAADGENGIIKSPVTNEDCVFTGNEDAPRLFRMDLDNAKLIEWLRSNTHLPLCSVQKSLKYVPEDLLAFVPDNICETTISKAQKAFLLCFHQTVGLPNLRVELYIKTGHLYISNISDESKLSRFALLTECQMPSVSVEKEKTVGLRQDIKHKRNDNSLQL